ncbi:hypothetical protein [Ruegeria arenilitoris]|uniref:hypothetical protein n=1 Tax=Ruegeria arenilitoris TaxID=1173585 RepID=UPI0034642406
MRGATGDRYDVACFCNKALSIALIEIPPVQNAKDFSLRVTVQGRAKPRFIYCLYDRYILVGGVVRYPDKQLQSNRRDVDGRVGQLRMPELIGHR